VGVIDYLKPESRNSRPFFLVCSKKMVSVAERPAARCYNVGMHIKTSSLFGYLMVRSLA